MLLKEIYKRNLEVLEKAQKANLALEQIENLNKEPYDLEDASLFFSVIAALTAQSKAPATEKFIAKRLGLEKLSSRLDRGDFHNKEEDTYIEFKASFTNSGENLNIRQIRLWQNVDSYMCIYVNELDLENSKAYVLSKEEMAEEVKLIGGFTHGTIEANKFNQNSEHSITISMRNNSDSFQRWEAKYKNTELESILFHSEEGGN